MNNVCIAYKVLFGKEPKDMKDHEISRAVLDRFDVSKLGEQLAKNVLFEIVNWVEFPNKEITSELVGRAEAFASELFDIEDEPHMDKIAALEYDETKRHGEKLG